MSKSNLKMVGNYGCYLDDDNVISFKSVIRHSRQCWILILCFRYLMIAIFRICNGKASRDSKSVVVASTI